MWPFLFLFFFISSSKTVSGIDSFYGFDSHPNFWNVGSYTKTGKKYFSTKPNSEHNTKWVKSEPYNLDANKRILYYQNYLNTTPVDINEWELWSGNSLSHEATNYSFGGKNETESRKSYINQETCSTGQPGYVWPNLDENLSFSSTNVSLRKKDGEKDVCTSTGYIAIHMFETWGSAYSELRNQKCNEYIPTSISIKGNQICKDAPNVAPVYQRYASGSTNNGYYHLGCEATIYVWGYQYSDNTNFQNWFRNGELRWSEYYPATYLNYLPKPDNHDWWNNLCQNIWTTKENWIYSGDYQLNGTTYTDIGTPNSMTTPTTVPTQHPTSTPPPTNSPSITPSPLPGDANGDGKVDATDFNIWKMEYSSILFNNNPRGKRADFNKDNKIDLVDYSIWRAGFCKN